MSPHGVLAVTFTNKAAGEMRNRTESLLNMPGRTLWVGTFHGIAHPPAPHPLARSKIAAELPDSRLGRSVAARQTRHARTRPRRAAHGRRARRSRSSIGKRTRRRRAREDRWPFDDLFLISHRRALRSVRRTLSQRQARRLCRTDAAQPSICGSKSPDLCSTISGASSTCWSTSSRTRTRSNMDAARVGRRNGVAVSRLVTTISRFMAGAAPDREHSSASGQDFRDVAIIRLEQNYRSTAHDPEGGERADRPQHATGSGSNCGPNGADGDPIACTRRTTSSMRRASLPIASKMDRQGGNADRRRDALSLERTEPRAGRSPPARRGFRIASTAGVRSSSARSEDASPTCA